MRIDQMEKVVEEKFEELFPDTVKTGGGRASNRSGYHAGSAYGSRIGINGTKRLGAGACNMHLEKRKDRK